MSSNKTTKTRKIKRKAVVHRKKYNVHEDASFQ